MVLICFRKVKAKQSFENIKRLQIQEVCTAKQQKDGQSQILSLQTTKQTGKILYKKILHYDVLVTEC